MKAAPAKTWIFDFLTRHRQRFVCSDWPELRSEGNRLLTVMWVDAFDAASVSEAEAEEASIKLGAIPPRFRVEHLPSMLRMIGKLRESRQAVIVPPPRLRADPPLPPPCGFASWRAWVKAGCPDFSMDGGPVSPAQKTPAAGPDGHHPPQPAGASTLVSSG